MSGHPDKTDQANGRWTKTEHQNFLLGLELYGKNWKKIEDLIQTRTGSQIRSHAQKYFLKCQKTFPNLQNQQYLNEIDMNSKSLSVKAKQDVSENSFSSENSYFVNLMIGIQWQRENFNFWQEFVDCQGSIKETTCNVSQKVSRKNSFVTLLESGYEQKHDTHIQNEQQTSTLKI